MSHYPRQPYSRPHPSLHQSPIAPPPHRSHPRPSEADSLPSSPAAFPFPSHSSIRLLEYQLGPVLGIGTYGEVRYAFHRPSSSHTALKLLDPQRPNGGGPAQVRKAVEEEVRLMKRCESAHCIKVGEVRHDVPFTGTFCSECACTSLALPSAAATAAGCVHCNHPASAHSAAVTRPLTLLSQELGMGGELFSILSHTGALSSTLARYYFHQLIDAVTAMHSVNVIHRDLKPENLILDHHFQLRVIDFGLSTMRKQPRVPLASAEERLEDEEAEMDDDMMYEALTQHQRYHQHLDHHYDHQHSYEHSLSHFDDNDDGTAMHHTGVGSQPYSAPEAYYRQLYSHRPYKGAPADIWSCGVILYVMLTSRPPFNRPLTRTYGTLQRDKHFIQFVKGEMDERIGEEARELLHGMLRVHADDRWGVEEIRRSRWWKGEVMGREEVERQMRERSEQTYKRMGRENMIQLLRLMRHEEGEKRRGPAPVDAHTVQRSKPMAIQKPTSPRSRVAVPASYLQPLPSLPDNVSSLSASVSVPSQLFDDAELLARDLSALHVGSSSPGSSPSVHDIHTSHLPSPLHERHQQQRRSTSHSPPQQAGSSRQPLAAAALPTADHSQSSVVPSSDETYHSFFRSARPPTSQPLSLTAQNSLKPTTWPQQRTEREREREGRASRRRQREDEADEEDDEDEEEEEEGVDDVDAGYENDSDSTSEDLEVEVEGSDVQAEVKGEEKKGR